MKRIRSTMTACILLLLMTCLFCLSGIFLCRIAGGQGFEDRVTAALRQPPRGGLSVGGQPVNVTAEPSSDGKMPPIRVVVIDPGHGGEDGGAQSAAGLYEKDVNLSVALMLRDLFEAAGVPVVMTRTEDKLLYDRNADFAGRKKVLDLAGRLTIAENVPDSLFLSVHMNAFPQTQYSGMQVWYSVSDSRSEAVAESVRAGGQVLDPLNHRRCRAAGSNIFLLHRLRSPAILVEGGFLSNPGEAARLSSDAYRQELALTVFASVMRSLNG